MALIRNPCSLRNIPIHHLAFRYKYDRQEVIDWFIGQGLEADKKCRWQPAYLVKTLIPGQIIRLIEKYLIRPIKFKGAEEKKVEKSSLEPQLYLILLCLCHSIQRDIDWSLIMIRWTDFFVLKVFNFSSIFLLTIACLRCWETTLFWDISLYFSKSIWDFLVH